MRCDLVLYQLSFAVETLSAQFTGVRLVRMFDENGTDHINVLTRPSAGSRVRVQPSSGPARNCAFRGAWFANPEHAE